MSSPTKNSIKETTDSRLVENLSITLIDGYFRVEKVKKKILRTYHPLCIIPKYFYVITFINCNGYKNGAFLYFSSPKSFTQTQFVITLEIEIDV